ncbi:hypothetical protein TI39_contig395g00014 [Zymoseptoria brevis]|uniref:Mei2-like C-terminal RNA recognition motif domain-containing protein n=1 Tax=Zymoseptoria brevis TaxID=1047168 RepID=A0A0F4GNT3_9PEZI|nr:hypothetical protein TI39_contig395g00014 [Zymoseptoria brevis]
MLPSTLSCVVSSAASCLKIRLDEYAFGRYDFTYLRMEFGQGVNMAYGFVHFISADDLYNYVQDFVGKLWAPNANDTKKQNESAIVYATVQGIDILPGLSTNMTSPTKTSMSGSMTSKEYARRVAVPHSLGFKATSGSPTRDKLRGFSSSAATRSSTR